MKIDKKKDNGRWFQNNAHISEQEISSAHICPEVHEETPHRGDSPAGPRLQREGHHDGLQEHVHHQTLQNIQGKYYQYWSS